MDVQTGSPSALGERNFRLYFCGDLASTLGSAAVPVALALAILRGGHSPTDLGIVLAAKTLPTVIFLLVGGVYADRLPRQLVMICSDVCRFGVELAVAVLLFSGQLPIWLQSVLMVAFGVGDAFFQPSATGLLPKVVRAPRLQQANGVLTASSVVAGPALASLGIFLVGPAMVFAFDAATFVASVFDEKIAGTVHIALGQGLPFLGGTNNSSLHWDMVKDMRRGGQLYCDGKLVQENGSWVD